MEAIRLLLGELRVKKEELAAATVFGWGIITTLLLFYIPSISRRTGLLREFIETHGFTSLVILELLALTIILILSAVISYFLLWEIKKRRVARALTILFTEDSRHLYALAGLEDKEREKLKSLSGLLPASVRGFLP